MLTVLVSALQLVAFCMPPAGDLAYNPGTCPDWELNQHPFGPRTSTQFTESYQPGLAPAFEAPSRTSSPALFLMGIQDCLLPDLPLSQDFSSSPSSLL